jgi:hypothetical protein
MKNSFLSAIIFLLLTLSGVIYPQEDKVQGVFFGIGVGPRLPISNFSSTSDLGYGFNFEVSYTDNDFIPVFFFAKVGFETYPGSQSLYKQSDYSNLSTNILPVNAGVRYYFHPLLENVVLIIPVVEASFGYTYYQKLNEFKPSSLRSNFTERTSKIGMSAGGGFSMFILEILATYNYFPTNQYIALDLRVRLPLYVSF